MSDGMPKSRKLKLEVNEKIVPSKDVVLVGKGKQTQAILTTPDISPDYWIFRVNLCKDQAIIAFPKFGCIAVGFAVEDANWNTNLPIDNIDRAQEIFDHIKENKKYSEIPDEPNIRPTWPDRKFA